jgi:hypothetical protein
LLWNPKVRLCNVEAQAASAGSVLRWRHCRAWFSPPSGRSRDKITNSSQQSYIKVSAIQPSFVFQPTAETVPCWHITQLKLPLLSMKFLFPRCLILTKAQRQGRRQVIENGESEVCVNNNFVSSAQLVSLKLLLTSYLGGHLTFVLFIWSSTTNNANVVNI